MNLGIHELLPIIDLRHVFCTLEEILLLEIIPILGLPYPDTVVIDGRNELLVATLDLALKRLDLRDQRGVPRQCIRVHRRLEFGHREVFARHRREAL